MNEQGSFDPANNTQQTRRLKKDTLLSKISDVPTKQLVCTIMQDSDHVVIKCYALVEQRRFKYGELIPLNISCQELERKKGEEQAVTQKL